MTQKLFFMIAVLCCGIGSAMAQDFQHMLEEARRFDDKYPRESVMLHLDNASYVVGDTLWYKAFVVRSSTLRPTDMSRVLYVELLGDAGNLLERSVLQLDSTGQAHGHFGLVPPLRNGFYEVRAYTRAMSNWGEAAEYSRVFPLFEVPKKAAPGDFTQLEVNYPKDDQYFKIPAARPYTFGGKKERRVEFFPEGGRRAAGVAQHITYRLTDGLGAPAFDSLFVYSATDSLICTTAPEHLGSGTFLLPAHAGEGAYLRTSWSKKHYPLPSPAPAAAIHASAGKEQLEITVQASPALIQTDEEGDELPLRAALVVLYRNIPKAAYPLELGHTPEEFAISYSDLGVGVNRLELVTEEGEVLASRQVFAHLSNAKTALPTTQVKVRQNAESYGPFCPIAVEVELSDEAGRPLPATTFALAVHDADGELIYDTSASLQTQLLLCAGLKGYVHHPEWYFAKDDYAHRRALDLLMQTQGWSPQTFRQLCGEDSFHVAQPIEDHLIVRGRVMKDKLGKPQPRAGAKLRLTMYNEQGEHMEGQAVTDSLGGFAFEAQQDFHDKWIAHFRTSSQEADNRLWSEIMIDQWWGGRPRSYNPLEYLLMQPYQQVMRNDTASVAPLPDTFNWEDTIPNLRRFLLEEAVVKDRKKYRPLDFNRYTYGGGPGQGIKHSDVYVNMDWELQRAWDHGIDFNSIQDFVNYIVGDIDLTENPDRHIAAQWRESAEHDYSTLSKQEQQESKAQKGMAGEVAGLIAQEGENVKQYAEVAQFKGSSFLVRINNGANLPTNQWGHDLPEQIKTLCISFDKVWARRLFRIQNPYADTVPDLEGIIYIYTREDWYNFRQLKGQHKRYLHGYETPAKFYSPNYRAVRKDNALDYRRTLYWDPALKTDAQGKATAVFFSNARPEQHISISVSGLTADGRVIEYR